MIVLINAMPNGGSRVRTLDESKHVNHVGTEFETDEYSLLGSC